MTGLTEFITKVPWVETMLYWYVWVDDAIKALEVRHGAWRRRGPQPRFSDSEVITVALVIDTYFAGHEDLGLFFLKQYHAELFPHLPGPGRFNARRTQLGPLMEQVRCYLVQAHALIEPGDRLRLVDSAPIPVTTYTRGRTCQSLVADEDIAKHVGYSASRKAHFFGYRLVATTSRDQVVDQWMLAPASYHDTTTLPGVLTDAQGQIFLADGAYHAAKLTKSLQAEHDITLLAPPRRNSRSPWPAPLRQVVIRIRRHIESCFSVLTTVFHIETPHARSLHGLVCRIATRLLAYDLCFLLNRQLGLHTA